LRQVASSPRHLANSCSISSSAGGIRSCGSTEVRGGSSHPAGTRPRGRSGRAARSCAAAPGTGSTPSARPPGRYAWTASPRAAPCRSKNQHRLAASPTAAGRTSPGTAPGGRCRCGSCCRPARPRHARARTRPARQSRNPRAPPRSLLPGARPGHAPRPEPTHASRLHPRRRADVSGEIISRRLKESQNHSPTARRDHRPWSRQNRTGRQPSPDSGTQRLLLTRRYRSAS
jgi:hypothetical protein